MTLDTDTALSGYAGSNGYYQDSNGAVTFTEQNATIATVAARYVAATKSFTFISNNRIVPEGANGSDTPFMLDSASSSGAYNIYRSVGSNGAVYQLTQLVIGASNPLIQLYYSDLALARVSFADTADGETRYAITPISFGLPFDWQTSTLSGSASYNGVVLGHARGIGGHVYDVTGTVTVQLDYSTGALTGSITLRGKDVASGQDVDLGKRTFQQDTPRATLDTFDATTADQGRLQARLAGPAAQEFIGGYDVTIADPQAPGAELKVAVGLAART